MHELAAHAAMEMTCPSLSVPNIQRLFAGCHHIQYDKSSTMPVVPADIVSATILVATAAHGSTRGDHSPCR